MNKELTGCAVQGINLKLLDCQDCGFESHRGMDVHILCLLCVVWVADP